VESCLVSTIDNMIICCLGKLKKGCGPAGSLVQDDQGGNPGGGQEMAVIVGLWQKF